MTPSPTPAAATTRSAEARAPDRTSTVVLVGGLVFLVARMVVAGLPFPVPLLAVGYLGLLTGRLVAAPR